MIGDTLSCLGVVEIQKKAKREEERSDLKDFWSHGKKKGEAEKELITRHSIGQEIWLYSSSLSPVSLLVVSGIREQTRKICVWL